VFLVGFWFSALNPAVQSRFIHTAREAQLMGAAASHAAFNIGNAMGAWLGGIVIAAGFGYLAPGWVGIALAATGGAFAVLSVWLSRRDARRERPALG
jgi:DHA1 family inner membrane transport protein